MTAPTAPATCPRCSGRLVRSWCLIHGTIEPQVEPDMLRDEASCPTCGRIVRVGGPMAAHMGSHEARPRRPKGWCACCREERSIDYNRGDANWWCFRCCKGEHREHCTRIPRTAEAARQRGMTWPVSPASGHGGETGGDA